MTGFLDGLRTIAAFGVLSAHCLLWTGWPGLGLHFWPSPGMLAKLAVDLFMIISGFLMAYNAHGREAQEPLASPETWLIFYVRRIFRIAPAYYLSLAVAILFSQQFLGGYILLADRLDGFRDSYYNARDISYSFDNILLHATFVFGLSPTASFSTQLPDWSLSLEMQFYLCFPFLMLAIRRFGVLTVAMVMVPACLVAAHLWAPTFREPSLLLFKLPIFFVGILLCRAMFARSKEDNLFLGALAVGLSFTQFRYYGFGTIWLGLGVVSIIILLSDTSEDVRFMRSCLVAALDNRFMRFGSELSYSVYLFHGFFIAMIGGALFRDERFLAMNPHARSGLLWLFVIIGTVLVATFVHRMVERPGIELGRMLISQLRQRTVKV